MTTDRSEAAMKSETTEEGQVPEETSQSAASEGSEVKVENTPSSAPVPSDQGSQDKSGTGIGPSDGEPAGGPAATTNNQDSGTNASQAEKSDEGNDQGSETRDTATDTMSVASKDQPYSTRGRSTDKDDKSGSEQGFSAKETLEEIGRVKDAPATMGASFLDAISEEDRHTRTRFIPDVEGMHSLRKTEVREDLAMARALASAGSSSSRQKGKKGDEMDVDEDESGSPEDDAQPDTSRSGAKVVPFATRELVLPSNVFVAPEEDPGLVDSNSMQGPATHVGNGLQPPSKVEAVTAFNPPRPPESIGAKKKHRMLRWERRPEDVEVDLNKYKKTVQKTRQELNMVEAEYTRLETMDAHLRWNYLNLLNLMNEEYTLLNEEIGVVQQECVKAADLLTSRTRSRGAGKGSIVMRDVMGVLKGKVEKTEAMETSNADAVVNPVKKPGFGGLAPASFTDWNRRTTFQEESLAAAWTVPGDLVDTPYGKGTVLKLLPPASMTAATEAKNDTTAPKEEVSTDGIKQQEGIEKGNPLAHLLPPRVSVKLPFGVGYFPLDAITNLENPCKFSDGKLAQRWQKMLESAIPVGSTIDVEGVHIGSMESRLDKIVRQGDADMEEQGSNENMSDEDTGRHMPPTANLLPTSVGRGSLLASMPIDDLEVVVESALNTKKGLGLGKISNPGVTNAFREWEDVEQEYIHLQASSLQLRNALVRQKRIRLLNEKTNNASEDRYNRATELVSEMRSDLKNLKRRLEDEMKELGIDATVTEKILSDFYQGKGSTKRQRVDVA
eukprot:Nitzschia sp. Nitz4//scaffold1_size375055//347246//349737//NITZ4_000338-RA/size375055-augustus-gene-0.736-mRNA-1//-1//CDS//3329541231//7253//frame0